MRFVIVIISFFLIEVGLAQDVNFGINFGVNPYNRFQFTNTSDSYKPAHSYYTYNTEKPGTGVIVDEQKFFTSVHLGISARVSRKKIGVNFEPQIILEYNRFSFNNPYKNNRIMSRKGLRIPIYLTYHFLDNPLAIHFNGGFIFSSSTHFDYQQPSAKYYATSEPAYINSYDYGNDHFYGVFYNDAEFLTQFMLGFGKKFNNLDYNLRYVSSLSSSNLLGSRWNIELHINFFFLNKDEFTTKNYLYEE